MLFPRVLLLLLLATISFLHPSLLHAQSFLEVSNYGASGSNHYGHCSGQINTKALTSCTNDGSYDFQVGQGIRIVGGGAKMPFSVTASPVVNPSGVDNNPADNTTRCYIVSIADPFEGISAPSSSTCIKKQPATLSYFTIFNSLNVSSCNYAGPDPAFLWYVSTDNNDGKGPSAYKLLTVSGFGNGQGCYYSAYGMDVGEQATTADRGGWPTTSITGDVSKNEDFYTTIATINNQQVTTSDTLPATFANLLINHDDALAVNAALSDGVSKGGAIIQFENGTYNIFRPLFRQDSSTIYTFGPSLSTSLNNGQFQSSFTYLQIPNGSRGGITIAGRNSNGQTTVLVTPPDHGGWSQLLSVGNFSRPSYGGAPAYPNPTVGIYPVKQDDKQVTLVGSPSFSAGDDIWLYSGAFQGPCQDINNGTGGNNCHFSELNTVSSVGNDGKGNTVLGLTYAASKSYFPSTYIDSNSGASTPNSYGLVRMPTTPHNITLENMQINTYNPVLTGGMVYGMLLSGLTLPYPTEPGPFGDGFKRDVTVQNSTWHFGRGDVTFNNSDEYDQFTNMTFNNNNIYGYAAPGAEGPFSMAHLMFTEGSSQIHVTNNKFYNASISVDESTDDTISGNQFNNGIISFGTTYQNSNNCGFPLNYQFDLFFGPKRNMIVTSNTFNIDSSFAPPYVILAGSSTGEQITNNTINYAGIRQLTAFNVSAGSVSGNVINFSASNYSNNSSGFCGSPSLQVATNQAPQQPSYPLAFSTDAINYPSGTLQYGIFLPTPGPGTTSPVCIGTNNTYNYNGPQIIDPSNLHQTCTQ